MHLWNEYEGRTIAGSYTLGKLLRSEGRNGFFATSSDKGNSAVIRITEAHFDEEEQLKRWRQVAEVHQTNLIEIENMGKTTFDGVALTYALMEPNDANLADVLKERPLTPAETIEVAKSVLAALRALHASGLVHEHIEPSNVLAVGEVVKLRSDCVRECVADVEFNTPEGCAELRKRDLHAFGLLLLQCLTLEKEWTPATNVPEPFKRVIPRALDGSWSPEQIAAVIDPSSIVPGAVAATAPAYSSASPNGTGAAAAASRPLVPAGVRGDAAATSPTRDPLLPTRTADAPPRVRTRDVDETPVPPQVSMPMIWSICGVAAVVLLFVIWHFVSAKPARPAAAAPAVQGAAPAVAVARPPATVATPGPAAPAPAPVSRAATATAGPGWYVIAYTYNHEGQAQTKAERLNRRHGALHAEVFSPTGHGPYLVSLNGAMSQNEAEAVWRKARRSGMPRDTFVRHY